MKPILEKFPVSDFYIIDELRKRDKVRRTIRTAIQAAVILSLLLLCWIWRASIFSLLLKAETQLSELWHNTVSLWH
jgi:hypothetical protein